MLTCLTACTLRLQMKGLSVDSLLDGIAVLRATTVDQQCASIEILDQYLVEDASNPAGQVNLHAAIAFAPVPSTIALLHCAITARAAGSTLVANLKLSPLFTDLH